MKRILTASVLGLAITGFFLATPSTSKAQAPVGVRVQVGGLGFSYNQGYPVYAPPVIAQPVTTFVPSCSPAPTVVVPTTTYYPYYPNRRVVVGYGPHYRHPHHYHR